MTTDRPLATLVVEDSVEDAELLLQELAQGGFKVHHARVETAEAMRAALARSRWDIVFSDYRMPSFSAPEALAVLQATGLDLPFIIISGTIGEETAVTALKAGAHDFIYKARLARLLPAVERELREAARRQDHRRAEAALRISEGKYRSLFDHAVVGIYQATVDGRFLTVNPALVTMLGYETAEDLIAVGLASLFADASTYDVLVQRSGEHGQIAGSEAVWRRRNGELVRVRLSGRLTDERDPSEPVFEVIVEDVTEQHRLHEELRQAQKMEAVGQLAGGVAHDFNNMLTAILGYAELLTEQIGPDKPIGRDLREIQAAAERASVLTRQLLSFSRKQVLAIRPVNLSEIVRTIQPMLRRLLGAPIRIAVDLADELDLVMADAVQLEHLLVNLSVNARDAMPDGGTLTIATANVTLDEAFVSTHPGSRSGRYATLSVTDSGTGMTADVRKRIFEPFFTTKERGRGTGLGLAAVYGAVHQLNGYVGVESEPGLGSTFTIYVPKTDGIVLTPRATTSADPMVGTETILLVEDEDGVRHFTQMALRRFGYRVIDAESAEAALPLLAGIDTVVHLLLTDVMLPGMDGRTLARRVTQDRPTTRVLFMSGYAPVLRTAEGFLVPGVHLLEKPFTAQALLAKIREVLGAQVQAPPRPA